MAGDKAAIAALVAENLEAPPTTPMNILLSSLLLLAPILSTPVNSAPTSEPQATELTSLWTAYTWKREAWQESQLPPVRAASDVWVQNDGPGACVVSVVVNGVYVSSKRIEPGNTASVFAPKGSTVSILVFGEPASGIFEYVPL